MCVYPAINASVYMPHDFVASSYCPPVTSRARTSSSLFPPCRLQQHLHTPLWTKSRLLVYTYILDTELDCPCRYTKPLALLSRPGKRVPSHSARNSSLNSHISSATTEMHSTRLSGKTLVVQYSSPTCMCASLSLMSYTHSSVFQARDLADHQGNHSELQQCHEMGQRRVPSILAGILAHEAPYNQGAQGHCSRHCPVQLPRLAGYWSHGTFLRHADTNQAHE
jgi:hypothetical protein